MKTVITILASIPRLALLVWLICSNWMSSCSGWGVFGTIMGLIFLPVTTLTYIYARNIQPDGNLSANLIFLVILGIIADFSLGIIYNESN